MSPPSKPRDAASDGPRFDPQEIKRALRVLVNEGQVFELRVLDAVTASDRRPHTASGYFDHIDKAVEAVAKIPCASGIYVTLNPVKPCLLARSVNKLRIAGKGTTTTDDNIERRTRLLVDCDPVRPAGIAASDEEHQAALERATAVDAYLAEMLGFPPGIVADSGNGGHLDYGVDLPVDDGGLIERCLKALAAMFDDEKVKIDTTVHNPARIVRLYGCVNGKGDADAASIGRPQRMARILHAPETLEVVLREKLESLAAMAPADEQSSSSAANGKPRVGNFVVAQWIANHQLDVTGPDPWKGGGNRWVFNTCPWNPAHTNGSAYIVQWPNGKIGAGCHHNSCQGKDWHSLRDVVEPGWRELREQQQERRTTGQNVPLPPVVYEPVLINLATVTPREVQWLWPTRIPLGKLTLIAGEPGLGKSFLTMDLAARVTRGSTWPDDPGTCAPEGSVILLSAEDDIEDTIRPRLDAAGADVSKIVVLQGVEFHNKELGKPVNRVFNLEQDLPSLEKALATVKDCKLIIIDPVTAYVGGKDSHKNAEIRGLLAPLFELAARYGVAVVAVTHLNKCSGQKAMHRLTGSLAFIAAARAGWLVAEDKENPKRRLLLPVKNNLAEDVTGLAYGIIDGVVAWEQGAVMMSADDAIGDDKRKDGHTERDDAADWLRELLADGPMTQKDVAQAAKANGISPSTLRRAKVKAGIQSKKQGFGKNALWNWQLPGQPPSKDAEDAQAQDMSTLDTFGELPESAEEIEPPPLDDDEVEL